MAKLGQIKWQNLNSVSVLPQDMPMLQNMECFMKVCIKGKRIYKERIRVTIRLSQITDLFGTMFDEKLWSVFHFLFAAVSCLLFNHATLITEKMEKQPCLGHCLHSSCRHFGVSTASLACRLLHRLTQTLTLWLLMWF
jgi:hypothetical protein